MTKMMASIDGEKISVKIIGTTEARAQELRRQVTASRRKYRAEETPRFTYPLTVEKCQEMREVWGEQFKINKALDDWYRIAAEQREEHVRRAAQTDAGLTRVANQYPELNAWLKGDQRVTAQWVANAYRRGGLLADEVGTGKTAGVVAGMIEAGITGPTLVVCPKISVKAVWGTELQRHCPDVPVYLAIGSRPKRERVIYDFLHDPHQFKVLVIVAEMLRVSATRQAGRIVEMHSYSYPNLYLVEWSALIIDESQELLGSMDVVRGNLASEGLKLLNTREDVLRLAVSATPFGKGGKVQAIFGTLHWLWPDEFPSRWAWLGRYFEITEDKIRLRGGGGTTKTVKRVGGFRDSHSEAQLWNDLGPRVLRRTMEEVSSEHRGLKNWIEVPCTMHHRQARQYRHFSRDGEIMLDGGVLTTYGTLDTMVRFRQFANGALRREGGRVVYTGDSGKLDRLIQHLEKHNTTRKAVIASQYNEFLDAVEQRLAKEGYDRVLRIDGKTTERAREQAMELFQNDPRYRLFILNSQAGGVSITLDAADEMHALDEMYPPEANTQLFGRIFRRGRVHEVFYYLYRSIGTIDEVIGYNVAAGTTAQLRLLDGRRGRDYVRTLARYRKDA